MKKTEERRLLDVFLKLRTDLVLTNITPSDPPDFLGDHAGARVGIEVTRVIPQGYGSNPRHRHVPR